MHEKTLLYSALTATALAATVGVLKAGEPARIEVWPTTVAITPVSVVDATNTLATAEAPIRLTASDGTGLKLTALSAEAAVEDPLALTELHLTFENPEDRILEGTFRITLPQGASLSRFAMKVGGRWQEGEVVEKQQARQVYEDFLHRRQDPALMEQGAGNEFTARVFPIPARGTKELVIAYSESLEAGAPYVLPLRGLPQLGTLDVNVHASGGRTNATFGLHQQKFTPGQDFVVEGKQLPRSAGLRAGNLAIARVVPFAASRPEPLASALVLVDTSASRGLGLDPQVKLVKDVLSKVPADAAITVACFDQEVAQVYEGKAGGFGDKEAAAITARGALGASDVEQALGWAAEQAKRTKAKRVVLVSDGVVTAGETDALKLHGKVEGLRAAGVERIDAIAVGGIRDDGFLRTAVRGVLDRDGVVLDGKLGADALARRLSEATSSGIPVKVEGARWSWPEKLDGLQAGDEVMVYVELDDAQQPAKISLGTQVVTPDLQSVDRPLVERAWARAKIQSLLEAPTDDAVTTKAKIINLSTRHRVISPHTALLVLETEQDYRRFNIDRSATVDILTVRDGRVAVARSSREWEARREAEDKATASTQAKRDDDRSRTFARPPPASAPAAAANASPAAAAAPPPGDSRSAADELGSTGMPPASGGAERGGNARFGVGAAPAPAATAPMAEPALATKPSSAGEATAGVPMEAPARRAPAALAAPSAAGLSGSGYGGGRGGAGAPRHYGGLADFDGRDDAPLSSLLVRSTTLVVRDGLGRDEVQRVVRGQLGAMRTCYGRERARSRSLAGRVEVEVVVDKLGSVRSSRTVTTSGTGNTASLASCVTATLGRATFPAPVTGEARFTAGFDFLEPGGATTAQDESPRDDIPKTQPYEGRLKTVMDGVAAGDKERALVEAKRWQLEQPGDILALVALGEAYEARGDAKSAARAYGSILELFSFRADSRRFAGERLERLADPSAIRLAIDTYKKAAEQRPDHPASHRLYAFALLKNGQYERAFEAITKGATRSYPDGRFAGAGRILREDMGLVAAAWAKAAPAKAGEIKSRLLASGGAEETEPSLRFVLNWETDANDVDFHIRDGKGGHAYYSARELASGGELYADVTTGYGPECFTIRKPRDQRAYPYALQAHYFSRGPMGYGMGKLQVIEHDGKGNLTFEERPFVVMVDRAYVDMGKVTKPAAVAQK